MAEKWTKRNSTRHEATKIRCNGIRELQEPRELCMASFRLLLSHHIGLLGHVPNVPYVLLLYCSVGKHQDTTHCEACSIAKPVPLLMIVVYLIAQSVARPSRHSVFSTISIPHLSFNSFKSGSARLHFTGARIPFSEILPSKTIKQATPHGTPTSLAIELYPFGSP